MSNRKPRHRQTPRPRRRGLPLCLLLPLIWASTAAAVNSQSLEAIRQVVHDHASASLSELGEITAVEVGQLDPRLSLVACPVPLEPFFPNGQRKLGHATVGVRCAGDRPWTLYVPVKVDSHVEVLAAAAPLARGTVLKESDLQPLKHNAAALPHGYFRATADVVGMQLRRSLRPGEIVSPNALQAPSLVERGQEIVLVAESGGIRVTLRAEALEGGAAGERIQVRNLNSRRIVEAEVIGKNTARVAL